MTSGNQHYLRSFIDSVNTACKGNVFAKKAELSKKTKRNIGNALIATGVGTPILFALRGKLKFNKFNKLIREGAVKNISELDKAVASHIGKTKAKLPKYKWEDFTVSLLGRGKRVHSKDLPVAVLRDGGMHNGPAYFPKNDFITLGYDNILNPKALMHELGHAADPHLNEYLRRPGLTFGELFKGLIAPERTRMLKAELRAWDNAKILKGDTLREAALDTYRNLVRGTGATAIVSPTAIVGGSILKHKNKEEPTIGPRSWLKAAQAGAAVSGDPAARRRNMARWNILNRQGAMLTPKKVPLRSGPEVRQGGPAVEQYFGEVNPYRNYTIAAPGTSAQEAAASGKIRQEDLPSTWMRRLASGQPVGDINALNKMLTSNSALRDRWDASSIQSYSDAYNKYQARQDKAAINAAYNEILRRLNKPGSNAKINQDRARRLAPLVAKNYRRNENGEWNLIDRSKEQTLAAKARGIGSVTTPSQQTAPQPQVAQKPVATAPTARPSQAVTPAAPVSKA